MPLRSISYKRRLQLEAEKELTAKLFIKQEGRCADCGGDLGWGSAKHEITFRSKGGNPLDEKNCVLLCLPCHGKWHGIVFNMD